MKTKAYCVWNMITDELKFFQNEEKADAFSEGYDWMRYKDGDITEPHPMDERK